MKFLLFFVIFFPFLLNSTKLHSEKPHSLLSQLEEQISLFQTPISTISYENLISFFIEKKAYNHNNLLNKTILAKALTIYAKLFLYGLNPEKQFQLKKAVYFFKLASEFGSKEALYYQSFLSFFLLDGGLFLLENMKDFISDFQAKKVHFLFSEFHDIQRLSEYLSKRNRLNSFISCYFSALQNHSESVLAMGYKYLQGLNGNGLQKSCSTAAIYYHEINKLLYLEHESFIPKYIEKKRLTLETLETEISSSNTEENDELEFLRMQANQNKLDSLLKLAYYHFYGLKGVLRNYEKSFEYFARASHLGDISAKSSLGYMYLKGLGVQKNHKLAYKEFNEAALRKDTRAKCGLGILYMNGWGVEKNERLGLNYFKEAADAGNAEGQYLYGSHLLSSNQKNLKKNANDYINLAAHQGHAAAMYALGLMHLDGNQLFYSCDIAVGMMRSAAERGLWAEKMKLAHANLKKNNKKLSFLLYLESSFLGLSNSHINSALLLDKFEIFNDEDLDFSNISEIIEKDRVFLVLKHQKILQKINILDYIFEDFLQISPNRTLLLKLLKPSQASLSKKNKLLAKNSYLLAAKELDSFSYLRLGDFFYYGLVDSPNYEKAADFYENVIKSNNNEENYMAQAYYNLAYMHQYGLGVEKDLNKSWSYYNRTYQLNRYSFFTVKLSQFLLNFEMKTQKEGVEGYIAFFEEFLPKIQDFHAGFISLGIIAWIILEILKIRQKNLIESFNMKFE